MSETETNAWVKLVYSGGDTSIYHTDKSCERLQRARNYRPANGHEVQQYRECRLCSGQVDHDQSDRLTKLRCPFCGAKTGDLAWHMRTCE